VAALGVRLVEAPQAPSRGEVRIRIPSGQRLSRQQRVALGDKHPSGDTPSLHAATSAPGWTMHTAIGQVRVATGMAECTTTGLINHVGSDSGSRVAVKQGNGAQAISLLGRTPCDRNHRSVLRLV
jgi:hypothetical protein